MHIKSFLQSLKKFFFAESWIDIFVQWLHRLPLPYWLTCTIIGLIILISDMWGNDFKVSVSPEYLRVVIVVSSISYGLYMIWHLENEKRDLFKNLTVFHQQNTTIKNSSFISKISRWGFFLLRVLFVLIVLLGLIDFWITSNQDTFLDKLNFSFFFIGSFFAISIIPLSAIKIGKILSSIYNLKSQHIDINLLDLSPLYKLSWITQRIALYMLPLSVAFVLYVTPAYIDSIRNGFIFEPSINRMMLFIISLGPLIILMAVSAFVIPVFWIRSRIIETKSNALAEIGGKLQTIFREQDQYADQGDYTKVAHLKTYTEALISRRDFIRNISEWPWETRVFREFSVAIFIPLVLWALQLYLAPWLEK